MISIGILMKESANLRRLLWIFEDINQISRESFLRWYFCDGSAQKTKMNMEELDLLFVEVEHDSDVKKLENLRGERETMELILLMDSKVTIDSFIVPELHPLMILREPLDCRYLPEQLARAFRHIVRSRARSGFEHRFSFQEQRLHRVIPYSEILYFETKNKKMYLYSEGREYEFYDSFSKMEGLLPPYFIRCHRSYMVNMIYVTGFNFMRQELILKGGIGIPVSRRYRGRMEEVYGHMTGLDLCKDKEKHKKKDHSIIWYRDKDMTSARS